MRGVSFSTLASDSRSDQAGWIFGHAGGLGPSSVGVVEDLILRCVCCLRPETEGLSKNIRVRSVINRCLEHARRGYFGKGDEGEYFLSAADWMSDNLERCVGIDFPVPDPGLRGELMPILRVQLEDTEKVRKFLASGSPMREILNEASSILSVRRYYELVKKVLGGTVARFSRKGEVRSDNSAEN